MSDITPVSVRITSGTTVVPGSILVAQSANGTVGQWKVPPTVDLIDPATQPTLASVVSTYNELIWGLASTSIIRSEPYITFGEAGGVGINIIVNGTPAAPWIPGANTKLAISTILEALNTRCGPYVSFDYLNNRFYMFAVTGAQIEFVDAGRSTRPDTAAHIMNRLIYNMPLDVSGSLVVSGNQVTVPFNGVHPVPASVTNLGCTATADTISVTWAGSADAIKYFIRITGPAAFNQVVETTALSYQFDNLASNTDYTITVFASSRYELSDASTTVRTQSTLPSFVYEVADSMSTPPLSGMAIYSNGNNTGIKIPTGSLLIGSEIGGIYFPNALYANNDIDPSNSTVTVKFVARASDGSLISETNEVVITRPSGTYILNSIVMPNEWQTALFTFLAKITLTAGMTITSSITAGNSIDTRVFAKYINGTYTNVLYYRKSSSNPANEYSDRSYIFALTG
jgi:hypothetical protein